MSAVGWRVGQGVRVPVGSTRHLSSSRLIKPAYYVAHHRGLHASNTRSFPEQKSETQVALEESNEQTAAEPVAAGSPSNNGTTAVTEVVASAKQLPEGKLEYVEPSSSRKFWTNFRLAFALPWRRFKSESVLAFKLEGDISDQARGFFDPGTSIPQLCQALQKAALDPRIKGIAMEIGPLNIGWGKLQEIRRYLAYFRASGKFTIAFMKQASEKEYYLASACEEIIAPPSASISLRGFAVSGAFLRGVLDKVGVEPQVKRIGKYKSAGDQLLRKDMSEPQREQLTALLDDIYDNFLTTVAEARNKTREEVAAMLEEGIYDTSKYLEGGWLTSLKYEDELIDDLKQRTGGKPDQVRKVSLRRYSKVSPSAFGLTGRKRIVVLRTAGNILGKSTGTGSSITPDAVIPQLRALAKDKNVAAVVLRVDSPGGDALASDLMWREIRKLGEKKPVIASMADVAASGGYYMAMACNKIVAEPLTITGSIGVVTGKFNLEELYNKVGYSKTLISRGRYAELLADNRSFTPEELELFDKAAEHAYETFRNKAAESRGMPVEAMQEVAQGRVWSGAQALQRGLVDALGGVHHAIAIAKEAAGIPSDEQVTVTELGRARPSPLALLGGGASAGAAAWLSVLWGLLQGKTPAQALMTMVGVQATMQQALIQSGLPLEPLTDIFAGFSSPVLQLLQTGGIDYLMTDVDPASIGGATARVSSSSSSSSSSDGGDFLSGVGEEDGASWESPIEKLLDAVL